MNLIPTHVAVGSEGEILLVRRSMGSYSKNAPYIWRHVNLSVDDYQTDIFRLSAGPSRNAPEDIRS